MPRRQSERCSTPGRRSASRARRRRPGPQTPRSPPRAFVGAVRLSPDRSISAIANTLAWAIWLRTCARRCVPNLPVPWSSCTRRRVVRYVQDENSNLPSGGRLSVDRSRRFRWQRLISSDRTGHTRRLGSRIPTTAAATASNIESTSPTAETVLIESRISSWLMARA